MAKDTKKREKKMSKGRWNLYDISNGLKRKNKFCPKCKNFLGTHKDRLLCGNCGYMESSKKN